MLHNLQSHPFASKTVAVLRNKETQPPQFRRALNRLGKLLSYEIAQKLDLVKKEVESPLGKANYHDFKDEISVIAILRAALPMAEGVIEEFENAHIGFFSASRSKMLDEKGRDFEIDITYSKLPNLNNHIAIIVDPMLATASTLLHVIQAVKEGKPKKVIIACAIASEYGIKRVQENHPDVEIYTGAIDAVLNEKGYIVPGLGDAGDRA
ncbi:MAG: uracil phosphoribosyltransferase, partial [Methanobacteriota archaeon]